MNDFSLSATVVTYNNGLVAEKTAETILENTKKYPIELFVADNCSKDGTDIFFKDNKNLVFLKNQKNIGFSRAQNLFRDKLKSKYHFVINPDISFEGDLLSLLADYMEENGDTVMCMPNVLNPDGTKQHLPKEIPTFKYLFLSRFVKSIRKEYTRSDKNDEKESETDFCSGCFFCIRTDVFKKLNGFDERFFMYMEDADLSVRAKKYGKIKFLPQFSVTHIWDRKSSKNIKYLFIHINSAFKFLRKVKTEL